VRPARSYTAGTMAYPRRLLILLPGLFLLVACGTSAQSVRIEPAGSATPPAAARSKTPAPASAALSEATPVAPDVNDVPAAVSDDAEILDAILAALGDDADHYSVVVRRLEDGRGAALNPEREYYAASLFKLAVLYEAERQRSVGALDFDEMIQISSEDVAEDLGTIGSLGLDDSGMIPVRAAVQAMVTRSDNTSAVTLLRALGPATVDTTLAALGLRHTSVNTRDLPTTAADMALLMEAIVRGRGVDPAWREDMRSLLLQQETRSGIPQLLPPRIAVGNKTGTWPSATHDVAFVDAPGGTYVIAVLSDRGWVWEPIARVSRAVYAVLAG
jgi:beta-lactamase class A